jgi:general secretion pathway protein D
MARLLSTAVVLALIAGCVQPPKSVLASPIVAQGADAPGGLPAASSGPSPSPPATGPRSVALDFENADIGTVIHVVSEIVGFSYILAPDVRGTVTVRTSGAIRREDVFPVFLSILEVNGFTAVKAGDVYKVARTETAREQTTPMLTDPPPAPTSPPDISPSPGTAVPPDQPVTQVLVPRFAAAATLATIVRPLVSERGRIIVHPSANTLVVTDTAVNVAKVVEIVRRLDVELAAEEIHVVQLQYADASQVADILNQVFAGARLARPPAIVADRRTNSLIIRARRSELEAIGRLLGHD